MVIVKDTHTVKCKKGKQNSRLPFPEGNGSVIRCLSSQSSSRTHGHMQTHAESCRCAHTRILGD